MPGAGAVPAKIRIRHSHDGKPVVLKVLFAGIVERVLLFLAVGRTVVLGDQSARIIEQVDHAEE